MFLISRRLSVPHTQRTLTALQIGFFILFRDEGEPPGPPRMRNALSFLTEPLPSFFYYPASIPTLVLFYLFYFFMISSNDFGWKFLLHHCLPLSRMSFCMSVSFCCDEVVYWLYDNEILFLCVSMTCLFILHFCY